LGHVQDRDQRRVGLPVSAEVDLSHIIANSIIVLAELNGKAPKGTRYVVLFCSQH
jgi:hypothetical protein